MRRLSAPAYRFIGRFSFSRFVRSAHPALYRLTGGAWILGRVLGCDTVLLTTVGRHTARRRTSALFAFTDGGRWFVIASRGGSGILPAWYRNLAAHRRVEVQHRRTRWVAVARDAEEPERARLWALAAAAYPGFDLYQAAADHPIPVVVLEREVAA